MNKQDNRVIVPESTVAKAKKKKEHDFDAHGISLKEYICLKTVPDWIKVLTYVIQWYLYPKHQGKVFYQKYSTIQAFFKKCGYDITIRNIEEAFRILKTPEEEGGVGLFIVEYAETTKSEWIAAGNNPKKWIYRKVHLDWNRIHKYFSIFTTEGTFRNLKAKSRLKKLVQCRSISYTKNLQKEFDKAMKTANIEKYTTSKRMFYGFLYSISRKYYDVTSLINKYIPEHEISLQEEADKDKWIESILPKLKDTEMDPERDKTKPPTPKSETPAVVKAFFALI